MSVGKIPSVIETTLMTERDKLDELEVPKDVDAVVVVRSLGPRTIVFSIEHLRGLVAQYDAGRQ